MIVDGRPFLILAGELTNSASSSMEYMEPYWPKLAAANMNTVLAAVTLQLVEPEPGKFDFALVDGAIREARFNHLRLIFLVVWKLEERRVQLYAAVGEEKPEAVSDAEYGGALKIIPSNSHCLFPM